jgi:hypothetical protein
MKAKAKAVIGRWAVQKGTDRMEVLSVYTCRTPSFFLCIPFPQYIHSVSSPFLLQSSQRTPYTFVVCRCPFPRAFVLHAPPRVDGGLRVRVPRHQAFPRAQCYEPCCHCQRLRSSLVALPDLITLSPGSSPHPPCAGVTPGARAAASAALVARSAKVAATLYAPHGCGASFTRLMSLGAWWLLLYLRE